MKDHEGNNMKYVWVYGIIIIAVLTIARIQSSNEWQAEVQKRPPNETVPISPRLRK
jgi:hypothetical protein